MESLADRTAHELSGMLAAGEVSAVELTKDALGVIERTNKALNSFLTVSDVQAMSAAKAVDEARARGEKLGPMAGIPVAVKDVLVTKGVTTTAGSRILEGFVPPYDATAVQRLRQAGAIIVGKTNMDEFAMGSSNENSGFGAVHHPWDLSRVPGGSSGGSAAAVAAGQAVAALGTDTGGSIRLPAAFCGLVAIKPTYGRVSRYGLIAFASSLDQVGPMTRDVTDAATLLEAISGHDPADATSLEDPADFTTGLDRGIKGLRVGIVKELFTEGMEPEVAAAVRRGIDQLVSLGAQVEECSLPSFKYALAAYHVIAPAEASSNLARFDGVRYGLRSPDARDVTEMMMRSREEGFGDEVKRRIMVGTYALSAGYYDAYYDKAQRVRTVVIRELEAAYENFDVLVGPTAPCVAFKLGDRVNDPVAMYLADIATIPMSLAGIPAITVPIGLADGLPVGLQIFGPHFSEAQILRAAFALEQSAGFDSRPRRDFAHSAAPQAKPGQP
ncbi:glutamyl-tRNA(Gln) amidotransferase subunit A [Rhizocola hellebori]|uniref:Glutamyl-tRNA(Gln) amidotransferase subunit A n=1 Tax=Rhizocola hellebori TaxID=1392758 RepID=A0A8J3Q349_9ACTN|nr:Asp-tRNA(Asn)/Glu-tRNA(Gln) amidotransferase subunit GatA [Rhizocola hellebori]GIH02614.1 glutamyl-tRNA(Gln) amidotransferase subunit A [Rhizocola hellebori]